MVSDSKLITITGGKWTTYRKMAEDVIDTAIKENGLPEKKCVTMDLRLYGYNLPVLSPVSVSPEDIRRCVQEEMSMTVEDYLSRRTRHLLLDARAAVAAAPSVAIIMAEALGKDKEWIEEQVRAFTSLAKNYIVPA